MERVAVPVLQRTTPSKIAARAPKGSASTRTAPASAPLSTNATGTHRAFQERTPTARATAETSGSGQRAISVRRSTTRPTRATVERVPTTEKGIQYACKNAPTRLIAATTPRQCSATTQAAAHASAAICGTVQHATCVHSATTRRWTVGRVRQPSADTQTARRCARRLTATTTRLDSVEHDRIVSARAETSGSCRIAAGARRGTTQRRPLIATRAPQATKITLTATAAAPSNVTATAAQATSVAIRRQDVNAHVSIRGVVLTVARARGSTTRAAIAENAPLATTTTTQPALACAMSTTTATATRGMQRGSCRTVRAFAATSGLGRRATCALRNTTGCATAESAADSVQTTIRIALPHRRRCPRRRCTTQKPTRTLSARVKRTRTLM